MGKGEVNTKPNAVKKTKGLKPMPAVMKARESGERKDLLRNRIELKRLQTLVDRLRNELEGVEDERKKVEAPIDPRYHLKGAARAAQQHYLPAQPVQAKPPNLLEEHKGKIGYLPKGKEFLQALVELANLKHSAFKHTKDAVALYNEVLQNDVKDHLDVRAKVLQCYQDKDDQAAATAFLRQISKPSKSSSVPSSSSVVAYEEAQSAVTSSYTAVVLSLLSPPEESTNKPSKGDKKGKKDVETVPTVSLSTDELLDAALATNPVAVWLLAYPDCFFDLFEVDVPPDYEVSPELLPLLVASEYAKAFGSVWWPRDDPAEEAFQATIASGVSYSAVRGPEKLPSWAPKSAAAHLQPSAAKAQGKKAHGEAEGDGEGDQEEEEEEEEITEAQECLREFIVDRVLEPPSFALTSTVAEESPSMMLLRAYNAGVQDLEELLTGESS